MKKYYFYFADRPTDRPTYFIAALPVDQKN